VPLNSILIEKLLFIFRNRRFFSVVNQVILKSASSLLFSFLCIVGKKTHLEGGFLSIKTLVNYACFLLREAMPTPTRPKPNKAIKEGSGTAVISIEIPFPSMVNSRSGLIKGVV
jgi:hypothetical protein